MGWLSLARGVAIDTAVPRCPYCLAPLDGRSDEVACVACGTPHHSECWGEHGRCVTLACTETRSVGWAPRGRRDTLSLPWSVRRGRFVRRAGPRFGEPRVLEVAPAIWRAPRGDQALSVALARREARPGDVVRADVDVVLDSGWPVRTFTLTVRVARI